MASNNGAIKQDVHLIQGSTYNFMVTFNSDEVDPLTDYTAKLQVRDKPGGDTLYFTLDESDGIIIDEAAHTYTVVWEDENTELLTAPVAYYDMYTVSPGGEKTYLVYGKVLVTPRVTV